MQFEPFDLLWRVPEAHGRVRYDISSSDMPAQRLSDVGGLEYLDLEGGTLGGSRELRELLAGRFGGRPDDYIVTCGASEANFAVFAGLLSPGDRVLVERPVYQPLEAIPRAMGAQVGHLVRPESEGFRLATDLVREALPDGLRLLTLTNLHNPTGAALDASTLQGIADLAAERGFYVLVDEVFRELAFGREPPTMGGRNERVLVTSGVGKFYGAGGLRIGWVRAMGEARRCVRAALDYMSANPPTPSDRIARALLRQKEKTALRNRKLIEEGRNVAREWAETTRAVRYTEPVGHLSFPSIDADTLPLADRLLNEHSTFLAPGECFGLPRHFRLNLGRGPEQLEGGLRAVSRVLR